MCMHTHKYIYKQIITHRRRGKQTKRQLRQNSTYRYRKKKIFNFR